MKGFVIAGTHSGAGKTTITLGLMAALRKKGLTVAPFKVGPDFIDPGHHAVVAGRTSLNLDGWMLNKTYNRATFNRHVQGCDIAIVEGVMGLFDGFSGDDESGSTAQMAKWLNLPVILVVSAAAMARSAAALVQGFQRFDPGVRFAGVIFNNLGSKGHLNYLKTAMDRYVEVPLLGGLLRNDELLMPERHLGLTTAEDRPMTDKQLDLLTDHIETGLNLDDLLDRLPEIYVETPASKGEQIAKNQSIARLGIARDQAFCFYYQDNLELLAGAGLELVPFSPLKDERLPDNLDGIYFGGGYPELHAGRLAENREIREQIRRLSRQGMPIYGECGGFMFLCSELEDGDNNIYPMCKCFPFRTRMHPKLRTLGYREVKLDRETLMGGSGSTIRGHEFHYSGLIDCPSSVETVYKVTSRMGRGQKPEGYLVHQTLGSYVHLHFGSRPACAKAFADTCRKFQQTRKVGYETQ